jgi:DNA mismatch repair protein MutS
MIEQYLGMKAKHPEAILLSRVGDFYEAYGDDAETIARLLQIALTSKESGGGTRIAMAGVPHHALDGYLAKLVAQQRIVALAEQLEVPVPNRLVRRDIVRVVTPGTLIEENWLERGQNNYLAALTVAGETIGVAHTDISTGRAAATAYAGQGAIDDVLAELVRIAPAEIVADLPTQLRDAIALALPGVRVIAPPLAAVVTRDRNAVPGFSLDEALAMRRALEALEAFVRRVGFAIDAAPFREPDWYRAQTFLALDANTRKHLELTKALGANAKATLLASLDRCRTSMGSRLLARWIVTPLIDRSAIEARAGRVEVLVRDHTRRGAVQTSLGGLFDLERIAQKIRFRRAGPRDLASLRRTLSLLEPLRAELPRALAPLGERIGDFAQMLASLERSLVDEPPRSSRNASRCAATFAAA